MNGSPLCRRGRRNTHKPCSVIIYLKYMKPNVQRFKRKKNCSKCFIMTVENLDTALAWVAQQYPLLACSSGTVVLSCLYKSYNGGVGEVNVVLLYVVPNVKHHAAERRVFVAAVLRNLCVKKS